MPSSSISALARAGLVGTVALGTLALVIACSDATAPAGLSSSISAVRALGTIPVPIPVVHVDADAVRVDGQMTTPTPCYTLSSDSRVSHDTLVVSVGWRSTLKKGEACAQYVQPWLYTVAVTGLPYGLTAIRVVYGPGNGTVVLEQPIVVP